MPVLREHDNVEAREQAAQTNRALDSVHARQLNVHEHHVRFEPWNVFEASLGIGTGVDALEVRSLIELAEQQFPQEIVIFHHKDFGFGGVYRGALS